MYGGENVKSGDSVFLWSSGKDGHLVGRGDVTAVVRNEDRNLLGARDHVLCLYINNVDWSVIGSVTTRDLAPYRDLSSDGPMEALSRLLYRQSHNKVARLPDHAATFLGGMFDKIGPITKGGSNVDQPASRNAILRIAVVTGIIVAIVFTIQIYRGASTEHPALSTNSLITQNAISSTGTQNAQTAYTTELKMFSMSMNAGTPSNPIRFRKMELNDQQTSETMLEVTKIGYECRSVDGVYEMENSTDNLGIVRIECGDLSYQVTLLNGKSYVKPWTGVLLGQDAAAMSADSQDNSTTNRHTFPPDSSSRKWTDADARAACNTVYQGASSDVAKCKSMVLAQPR